MKYIKIVIFSILAYMMIYACSTQEKFLKINQDTLDAQIDNLVSQIVSSLSQNKKSKIAIIEFSDIQGNITNFGRYLAEELTTRLYLTNKFEVIERQLLNKVLQEHQLTLTGMVDESSAKELGKILGVDAIASGSITDLGRSVKVNARLISAETGKLFSVASVKILKDDVVNKLMGQTLTSEKNININQTKSDIPLNLTVEKEGFKIEFVKCEMSNRNVVCHLKVTNITEDDKDFQVTYGWHYKTKIYDDMGNEYVISLIRFASKYHKIKGLSQYDGAKKKIIAGTSVDTELHFEKVSSKASKITLLQILCGYRGFKVEFRDIPISNIE